MSKHNVKLKSLAGRKLTAFDRALVENMATRIIIAGGLLCPRVEVYGCEAIGNYVNGTAKRSAAVNMVLNHYRTYPRTWQFWCGLFYKDKATGVTQYSSNTYEPLYGTSHPWSTPLLRKGTTLTSAAMGGLPSPASALTLMMTPMNGLCVCSSQ